MGDFDLVIRNGLVFDGRGGDGVRADVAVTDGLIQAVGIVEGRGTEEIDATAAIVTPGFVDIHTHYDGQVTWGERLSPSSSHGVTTIVMGNCGVGFAPCRPGDRDNLICLMEGVEDIPGVVMATGIPWHWETFPEFMDFLAGRRFDVDVGAQLPHAPLRVYAMGQRGLDREPATAADMALMKDLASEAVRAGALGVATSRSLNHRSADHQLMPGVSAAESELVALGEGVREGGRGVLQAISDFDEPEADFNLLRRIVDRTGVPMSFSLMQVPNAPDRWKRVLEMLGAANVEGSALKAQVCTRPIGALLGLELNFNVFSYSASYVEIAHLPLPERIAAMGVPDRRARIIAEWPTPSPEVMAGPLGNLAYIFLMGAEPDYEPALTDSVAAQANAMGIAPADHAYDLLLADGGKNIFYIPAANYVGGTGAATKEMINHPDTVFGLGDGGAHVGLVCDASQPTYALKRWVGDGGGGTMSLGRVIKALTSTTAHVVNLDDRGVVAPGYRADLNVIDMDRLKLLRPYMVYDLPNGAGRLDQRAEGYIATIVGGKVTYRNGEPTGDLPGRLVRGAQEAPSGHSPGPSERPLERSLQTMG